MIVDDDHLAHDLATSAGQRLLDLRDRADFSDQVALRAAGDRLSHEYITAALAAHRHGDALLSEEGKDDLVRLAARRVWIVDPLDGTREFGEAGRTDWAVHVALWERADQPADERPADRWPGYRRPADQWHPHERPADDGGPRGRLVAGAVALPAQGQTFSTVPTTAVPTTAVPTTAVPTRPAGTAGEGSSAGAARLRLVVSRTRPPDFAARVAADIAADVVLLGSAGAKIIAVLTGAADAYVHAGGQHEWDSAAPVAVAQAAGLHASRIDGRPLVYNQRDPRLPDILVCRSAIAEMLLEAIRSAYPADGSVDEPATR